MGRVGETVEACRAWQSGFAVIGIGRSRDFLCPWRVMKARIHSFSVYWEPTMLDQLLGTGKTEGHRNGP